MGDIHKLRDVPILDPQENFTSLSPAPPESLTESDFIHSPEYLPEDDDTWIDATLARFNGEPIDEPYIPSPEAVEAWSTPQIFPQDWGDEPLPPTHSKAAPVETAPEQRPNGLHE